MNPTFIWKLLKEGYHNQWLYGAPAYGGAVQKEEWGRTDKNTWVRRLVMRSSHNPDGYAFNPKLHSRKEKNRMYRWSIGGVEVCENYIQTVLSIRPNPWAEAKVGAEEGLAPNMRVRRRVEGFAHTSRYQPKKEFIKAWLWRYARKFGDMPPGKCHGGVCVRTSMMWGGVVQ